MSTLAPTVGYSDDCHPAVCGSNVVWYGYDGSGYPQDQNWRKEFMKK